MERVRGEGYWSNILKKVTYLLWRYIPTKTQLSHVMFVPYFIVGLSDSAFEFHISTFEFTILHSSFRYKLYIRAHNFTFEFYFYIRVSLCDITLESAILFDHTRVSLSGELIVFANDRCNGRRNLPLFVFS